MSNPTQALRREAVMAQRTLAHDLADHLRAALHGMGTDLLVAERRGVERSSTMYGDWLAYWCRETVVAALDVEIRNRGCAKGGVTPAD